MLLLGDFSVRVGKSNVPEDIIGQFREPTSKKQGKVLIGLLKKKCLAVVNGQRDRGSPQWTW